MSDAISPINRVTPVNTHYYRYPHQENRNLISGEIQDFSQLLHSKGNTEYLAWLEKFLGTNPDIPSALKETLQYLASFQKGTLQFATSEELQAELRKALQHFSNVITYHKFLQDEHGHIYRILPDPRDLAIMEENKVAEKVAEFLHWIEKIDARQPNFAAQ